MKTLRIAIWICACLFIGVSRLYSQAAPGDFADANHPAGAPDPEKLDAVWQVDPINDQVSISISFPTTPQGGRGPKVPFSLLYNSGSTVTLQSDGSVGLGNGAQSGVFIWSDNPIAYIGSLTAPAGPWTTTGPYFYTSFSNVPDISEPNGNGGSYVAYAGCTVTGPYMYADANGSPHDINLLYFSSTSSYAGSLPWAPACQPASTQSPSYWPSSATSDGSTLSTSQGTVIGPDGTSVVGSTLTDANGNSASLNTLNGVTTATDALGRTVYKTNIPIGKPGQIPAGSYYVTTYGATGPTETYTVVFSTISGGSFNISHPTTSEITSPLFCMSCASYYSVEQPTAGSQYSTLTAVTEIELPDNTSAYSFSYDSTYGTISKITFPTGGYARFVWGIRDKDWSPYGQFAAISAVVVTDAYTAPSSGSSESHWAYAMESLTTSSTPIGQVTAPDTSVTNYAGACFVYSVVPYYSMQPKASCKEASHVTKGYSSFTGTIIQLQSDAQSFYSNGSLYQDATTLYDGPQPLQTLVQYLRDSYNNVIEKDESGYYSCTANPVCAGPTQTSSLPTPSTGWLRKTYTTFAYTTNSALASAHIIDKPSQITITDGSGTPYSLVNYNYDNKGNLLSESHCLSITGTGASATCASPSSAWQVQYTYDSTGQLLTKTEPYNTSGATTTNTWTGPGGQTDSHNGYLTTVAYPNGATDTYTYSQYTGQALTHTDWNQKTTNFSYGDSLNRPTSVVAPATTDGTHGAGGSASATTTYTYNDAPGSFSVEEQHTVNSLGVLTSTTSYFDGLGRKFKTLSATPSCTNPIEVDTVYDSMSRVYTVSNPYCTTSDPTYGLTTLLYDGLGRKYKTTTPDNAVSAITYASNATEFTDPPNGTTSPQHIQQIDGLGRLLSVCEVSSSEFGTTNPSSCGLNISGTGYLTAYSYDPLSNLTNVSQHGVSRWFTYDAMSRLTQAMNPETGTTADVYAYTTTNGPCSPAASEPCSRTDARGIVTNYGYDKMRRLVSKTYSSGGTPISCYQYDAGTGFMGRLKNAWTQLASSGSCTSSPSSPLSLKSFLQYDAVGRPLQVQEQTCVGGKCSGPSPYQITASYDLAGNTTTLANSVGANNSALTLTNFFDSASRPCLTTSSWTSGASPNLFQVNPTASSTSPGYSPAGGLQNFFLGSTSSTASTSCGSTPASPINEVLGYNKRFWVNSITATGQIP